MMGQRAPSLALARFPDERLQRVAHLAQLPDVHVEVREFPLGDLPRFLPALAIGIAQERLDFGEGKAQGLRAPDESDPLQRGGRVASMAPDRLGRLIDQPAPLVVADCLDVNARFLRQPADRDSTLRHAFLLSCSRDPGFIHYTRTQVRLP
jgi:hypothetical protein